MKKIYLFTLAAFLLVMNGLSQAVTVTNPGNTTPALTATYGTLAAAVTALSGITAISGPVIITLNAGNPETAPAGGYVITFAATTTAVNNITFTGSNNTITASAAHTVGNLSDGIFKLLGADYITIQNFVMQENPANTISATAATNNMTEWGIALLRVGPTTNGSQNNTIQNNTISLNKAYRNTFGIYSNARHVANTPTTAQEATAFSGSNSGNKVYANNISNVMMGIVFIGPGTQAYHDTGNDIGGSSFATGNTITNWGGNTQLSNYAHNPFTSYCIYMQQQVSDNVSYNTINSGTVGAGVSTTFSGILKEFPGGPPTGTYTSTISYNTITMSSAFSGGNMECIRTNTSNASTVTIDITNNNIVNCSINTVGTTSPFFGIYNTSAPGTLNINNNIIRGLTTVSTGNITAISNTNPVVNTININNNKIGDAVAGAVTNTTTNSGSVFGISNTGGSSTATVNINNNSLDGFSFVTSAVVNFIHNTAGNPAAVYFNNNQLGSTTGNLVTYSGAQGSIVNGINNTTGNTAMALSIQNNDFTGITYTSTGTASCQLILSSGSAQSILIHNNTFTNLSLNSSGAILLIQKGGVMAAGATNTITNNRIVGSFSKTAGGSSAFMYSASGSSQSGVTTTVTGNNFSNISISGNAGFYGISDQEGSSASGGFSPTKTISGNIINNVTMGSGNAWSIFLVYGENLSITSNTVSNISGSGQVSGINYSFTLTGPLEVSANTISSLSSSTLLAYGISGDAALATTINIHNNNITGLASGGTNANVIGILHNNGAANIYNNNINNFSHTGGGTSIIHGIRINGGATSNIYRNNLHSFLHSGAVSTLSPAVMGINISTGTTVTAHNNFVAGLNASNASLADAVRGISVTGTNTLTNYNLYYNSIYLNAASSGTDFGTSGIYHTTNLSPTTGTLTMKNNIIVNTSTANGTGVTAAYRRSSIDLDNYASTSDHNLFYAGTPSATRLIFYDGTNSDQTMAAYKTRVSPRDANSISAMPAFTSATNLHLTTANCQVNSRGIPIAGITNDIDLDARHATTPDIGADEFTAGSSTTLAGVAGAAVCEDRTVSVTGTTYVSNVCDLIARIVPSGGDPVAGNINVCVTLDAVQQYFNGEPYVQRHYDLEPVNSNQTSTSATVTLYFTNQEFVDYNTNNPVWPQLPTATLGNADPNRANVKVTQFHGAATTSPSSPGNYLGVRVLIIPTLANVFWNGTYWEITFNIAGFSGFYVHSNMWNAPLPVSVNYFTGVKQGSDHLLNWKVTCAGTPSVTMLLERSADSRNFTGINSITADAARCNQPFNYTDANPLPGMNYYRLKMIDADGKISYSGIVALLNASKGFDIISIAPNPVVTGNFSLNVSSAQASIMDMTIVDMQGRIVNRQTVRVIAGFNSLAMNVGNLAAGTYTIQAVIADERSKPVRFIKQ